MNAANTWLYGTVETHPDGSTDTVYTNYAGDVMMDLHSDSSVRSTSSPGSIVT